MTTGMVSAKLNQNLSRNIASGVSCVMARLSTAARVRLGRVLVIFVGRCDPLHTPEESR